MTKLTQTEMDGIVKDWASDIKYEDARRQARSLKRRGLSHIEIMEVVTNEHGEQIAALIEAIKNSGYYHYKNLERV